jgi:uncharacterized membrane protein
MAVKEASNEKLMGAIAYFGGPVTGIIFLLVEKTNPFIRFHAMQSTVVFGLIWLFSLALSIVPILGTIIMFILSPFIMLLSFILWIVLMIKAFNGEKYKLPYFGDLAEKQLAKLK